MQPLDKKNFLSVMAFTVLLDLYINYSTQHNYIIFWKKPCTALRYSNISYLELAYLSGVFFI